MSQGQRYVTIWRLLTRAPTSIMSESHPNRANTAPDIKVPDPDTIIKRVSLMP